MNDFAIPEFDRPSMWWALSPNLWQTHRRFSQVPPDWRDATVRVWLKRAAAGDPRYTNFPHLLAQAGITLDAEAA